MFRDEAKLAPETKSNSFPNPFNSYISKNINVTQEENLTIRLTDVTGKIVAQYNEHVAKGNHTANIKNLEQFTAGAYYLSTYLNSERIQTEVLVKQ